MEFQDEKSHLGRLDRVLAQNFKAVLAVVVKVAGEVIC